MKFALLNTAPEDRSLLPGSKSLGQVLFYFLKSIESEFDATIVNCDTDPLPDPADYDGFVLGGSPADAFSSEPWIVELREMIRCAYELKKRMVGVCFGHQVIAHALGGRVNRSPSGWSVGAIEHTTTGEFASWQTPAPSSFRLHCYHADQVLELPPDARVLATAPGCPHSIIQIGSSVLGIQGHPEFSSAYLQELLAAPNSPLPPAIVEQAKSTFTSDESGSAAIGNWMIRFLYNRQ